MRVLVCGSRDWSDPAIIGLMLGGALEMAQMGSDTPLVIIDGQANGADLFASCWFGGDFHPNAPTHDDVKHERYPADWKQHGKAAGPIRNQRMLDEGGPELVLAFRSEGESRGTDDMIDRCKRQGVLTYVIRKAS